MAQYLFVCEYHDEDNQARFIIVSAESYVDAERIANREGKLKGLSLKIKSIGSTSSHPSNSIIYSQELVSIAGNESETQNTIQ